MKFATTHTSSSVVTASSAWPGWTTWPTSSVRLLTTPSAGARTVVRSRLTLRLLERRACLLDGGFGDARASADQRDLLRRGGRRLGVRLRLTQLRRRPACAGLRTPARSPVPGAPRPRRSPRPRARPARSSARLRTAGAGSRPWPPADAAARDPATRGWRWPWPPPAAPARTTTLACAASTSRSAASSAASALPVPASAICCPLVALAAVDGHVALRGVRRGLGRRRDRPRRAPPPARSRADRFRPARRSAFTAWLSATCTALIAPPTRAEIGLTCPATCASSVDTLGDR